MPFSPREGSKRRKEKPFAQTEGGIRPKEKNSGKALCLPASSHIQDQIV